MPSKTTPVMASNVEISQVRPGHGRPNILAIVDVKKGDKEIETSDAIATPPRWTAMKNVDM